MYGKGFRIFGIKFLVEIILDNTTQESTNASNAKSGLPMSSNVKGVKGN
jgi:hypothetical protein